MSYERSNVSVLELSSLHTSEMKIFIYGIIIWAGEFVALFYHYKTDYYALKIMAELIAAIPFWICFWSGVRKYSEEEYDEDDDD